MLGFRPSTSSDVISAEIGPAVKPIQGNMLTKNPGSPGTSPRIGFQSAVPLTMAGHTRSSRTEASAGTTRWAVARLALSDSRSTAGRLPQSPAPLWLQPAGQPPPMRKEPLAACFRVSFSPAK